MLRRAVVVLPFLLAAGCASDVDERPASWSYIHAAIVLPNCATSGCHSTLSQAGGQDLENERSAYNIFVNPNDATVEIKLLLRGKVPNFYRMPPDQPLPEADIQLIERWVSGGKQDN